MGKPHEVLNKYWGYDSFRPMQEEIIISILEGKDTLALLPTGGGKSLTFQIPSMMTDGITLVVTPLIALMKDQVENLKSRGIQALAVYSGMSSDEIDITIENAINGDYKFLYLSPERLQSEIFRSRVSRMNINFLVVDEAHCISQWGHDFRPDYLKIKEIRHLAGIKTTVALTATATDKVVSEIVKELELDNPNIIKSSFKRDNLSYIVRESEDKNGQLIKIARGINGSGIVYVRERKRAEELAQFLEAQGLNAQAYHAGMSSSVRSAKQDDWKNGNCRIIVATNAFGMGIDKSDVRFVCHFDPPESVEAYFQEAGRAGRDGNKSFAVLLWNRSDIGRLRKILATTFPSPDYIRDVYQKLFIYYGIAYGAGKDQVMKFNLMDFAMKSKLHALSAYYALKYIEKEGYFEITDEIDNPSKVKFIVNRDELYHIQLKNTSMDAFIKTLLRLYTGMFSNLVPIDEEYIARLTRNSKAAITSSLIRLSGMGIATYMPSVRSPLLILKTERLDDKNLYISPVRYQKHRGSFEDKIESIIGYFSSNIICRSQFLLSYFGENDSEKCGVCDVCIEKKRENARAVYDNSIEKRLIEILLDGPKSLSEISLDIEDETRSYIELLREMIDRGGVEQKGELYHIVTR